MSVSTYLPTETQEKLFSAAYLFKELTTADCSLFGSILMFAALFDANKGFVSPLEISTKSLSLVGSSLMS